MNHKFIMNGIWSHGWKSMWTNFIHHLIMFDVDIYDTRNPKFCLLLYVTNYVTHMYFCWKRYWKHTFLFLLLLLGIWDLLLTKLETYDLLQFDLLIVIGNPWIVTTRNWRHATRWAWNLGHVAIWNLVVVKNLWLVVGWVGNLGFILIQLTIVQNLWCVVVHPLLVCQPITHPHT